MTTFESAPQDRWAAVAHRWPEFARVILGMDPEALVTDESTLGHFWTGLVTEPDNAKRQRAYHAWVLVVHADIRAHYGIDVTACGTNIVCILEQLPDR